MLSSVEPRGIWTGDPSVRNADGEKRHHRRAHPEPHDEQLGDQHAGTAWLSVTWVRPNMPIRMSTSPNGHDPTDRDPQLVLFSAASTVAGLAPGGATVGGAAAEGKRGRLGGGGERLPGACRRVPFLLVAILVAAQLAMAGASLWSAGIAARAGARAALVGGGAEGCRAALPAALREGARVAPRGRGGGRGPLPRLLPGIPDVGIGAKTRLGPGG